MTQQDDLAQVESWNREPVGGSLRCDPLDTFPYLVGDLQIKRQATRLHH